MIPRSEFRKANISIAAGLAVLIVGMVLFGDAGEGAVQLVGVAMWITMFGLLTFFVEREDRRRKRAKRDQ